MSFLNNILKYFKGNRELLLLLVQFLHHPTGPDALGDLGRDSEDFDKVTTITKPQPKTWQPKTESPNRQTKTVKKQWKMT